MGREQREEAVHVVDSETEPELVVGRREAPPAKIQQIMQGDFRSMNHLIVGDKSKRDLPLSSLFSVINRPVVYGGDGCLRSG
jgi:hypothetical protein